MSTPEVVDKFESDYNDCSIRYGDLKAQLSEDIIRFVTPIREKAEAIQHDADYLKEVMEKGATKARESAQATIQLVRSAMGLKYY